MSKSPTVYQGRAMRSRAGHITLLPLLQYERNRSVKRTRFPQPSSVSALTSSSIDAPSPAASTCDETATPFKTKTLLTEAQAVGAGQRQKKDWKKPSKEVCLMQWVQTNMLTSKALLDKYRAGDNVYFEEEYNKCWKSNRVPTAYRNKPDGKSNMKGMVWQILQRLFLSNPDVPYEINHWKPNGEWKGLGLFTTEVTTTNHIARAFEKFEPDNAQLLWAPAALEYYESIYTCRWSEKKARAKKRGWYLKERFVKEETDTHYRFEAPFFLYGRLMFANHGDQAPFYFRGFKPIVPKTNKGRMFGFLTIEIHDATWDYAVPAGHQILLHYDHNMTTFGEKPAIDLDNLLNDGVGEEDIAPAPPMTAAEEQMQVLAEVMEERDDPHDSDYQSEIVVQVGDGGRRRLRSRAKARSEPSDSD